LVALLAFFCFLLVLAAFCFCFLWLSFFLIYALFLQSRQPQNRSALLAAYPTPSQGSLFSDGTGRPPQKRICFPLIHAHTSAVIFRLLPAASLLPLAPRH